MRKAIILEAAVDCISSVGVENTSFEAIGKKAGMLKAHVAYYFPSRDALIEEVVKLSISTVQSMTVEAVKAESDNQRKMAAFVAATFRWIEQFPKQTSVVLLLYYYASFKKSYQKTHDRIRSLGAERIQAILQLRAHLGDAPPETLAEASKLIQSILTGNIVDFLTTAPKWTLDEVRERTERQVENTIVETISKIIRS